MSDFCNHIVCRPADLLTTGVGHHAESAVLATAFHDGYERRRAVRAGVRKIVELLDFRKADVHYAHAVTFHAHFGNHIRQAMQGLWAEDHIDIRRPIKNRLAFLAGDTAANADYQFRFVGLEFFPATQLMENLLLCFFTDRAGVQQQNVGVIRRFRHFNRFAGFKQVGHAG